MDHLQTFFNKFKKFTTPHKKEREYIVEICAYIVKQEIPLSLVRISGRCVYINLSPLLKGEVIMRKKDILDKLNKKFSPTDPFVDLR